VISIIGWSLAALLGLLVLALQWSWKKHALESLMQSQFIAMALIDPAIYRKKIEESTSNGWKMRSSMHCRTTRLGLMKYM
jgi:hypothetical protein